jgi:beta-xylosidase
MRWVVLVVLLQVNAYASKVWVADNGDGTYGNPILHADYSDPDAIRVGGDFYMTSSSFNCAPGLPILHSKDLVNWTLIGHALKKQIPDEVFEKPQHGNGCWAPAIRYRKGRFYIYYPDPDSGIWLVTARDPAGPWEPPVLVVGGEGIIDPCPLWDDDGKAYLVHAWAGSRAGVNSLLTIRRMNPEGTQCIDDGVHVFDGHEGNPTVEGPKLYKRNGYYYIFAPAGGVTGGWQLVLRSRDIYGPYESKVVLDQGTTPINGPHQGAWVETESGQSWFIHFQDKGAYGRIVHLEPMNWVDDWPVMGVDKDGDGKGEPVLTFRKPDVKGNFPIVTPADSDEFDSDTLGLQWQWQANPKVTWMALIRGSGYLRLFAVREPEGAGNLWDVPSLLLQKFPAPDFTATTGVRFTPQYEGKRVGLVVMGRDYACLSLSSMSNGVSLAQVACPGAERGAGEKIVAEQPVKDGVIYLRVHVASPDARCEFSFSPDGEEFTPIGETFVAKPGKWIGAKVGLFCLSKYEARTGGYADIDWFRVE